MINENLNNIIPTYNKNLRLERMLKRRRRIQKYINALKSKK